VGVLVKAQEISQSSHAFSQLSVILSVLVSHT
jgi:hypothetical protein